MNAFPLGLFASAFALGFFIAMPVGPISLLILRRTVAGGVAVGIATGLGAATADTLYALLAAFGLSAVTALLVEQAALLGLAGGLMLVWLGIGGFRAAGRRAALPAAAGDGGAPVRGILPAFVSAVGLTLTNPLTVVSFAGAFAGIGLAAAGGMAAAAATVAGLGLGSATWQLTIVAVAGGARRVLAPPVLAAIDRLSGLVLVAFGGLALWNAWAMFGSR
ncbi:LysE family translocator [Zavarzinia compransoris]|uniref:Lysine transporter LysE n=1 Tax=Zavarzinia compransoris TaxID=1264899 RepID=A0A317E779_9PROT|nr:LysE family transporter [Zavarzinia compransoris]PWR22352.1 lysine transporter LysE [Zavarzinia compransoris]TDP46880.1 threonine/homoserine/homoserine lactone efflux protein [Zavarzinia compransoris]